MLRRVARLSDDSLGLTNNSGWFVQHMRDTAWGDQKGGLLIS